MIELAACVRHIDDVLGTSSVPDYDDALNGLQMQNRGVVHRVAAAVDFCLGSVRGAAAAGADLLIVHHGMFWGDPRRIIDYRYESLRMAFDHDMAVYASHLPLDLHPVFGNNAQLATALGLVPAAPFGRYRSISIGVAGRSDLATAALVDRVRTIVAPLGGQVVATDAAPERRTRQWAIVTGAGASSETLAEAAAAGVDTLIVGEGPHHTAVEAVERGIAIIFAGHYATETFGVQALARDLEHEFGLPWTFVHLPTGL
jgi:dinuclear metal center YbgI/SA1388 family protein